MKFLRMKPGHGEIVLAEGDPEVREDEALLIRAFREQLEAACGPPCRAAGPTVVGRPSWSATTSDIPRDADRVIFFPRASGG